jgi:hypothetical protein
MTNHPTETSAVPLADQQLADMAKIVFRLEEAGAEYFAQFCAGMIPVGRVTFCQLFLAILRGTMECGYMVSAKTPDGHRHVFFQTREVQREVAL